MTAPVTVLRRLDVAPARPDPAPRRPALHEGPAHPLATFPGGLLVCLACQRAELCVCGSWIVGDNADGGFAAVAAHQRTEVHEAYHRARNGCSCGGTP